MIYVDNAAATKVCEKAIAAMMPYLTKDYGNPSSPNAFGAKAKQALIQVRRKIASVLGAEEDEIIFTSGGTEANNFAVLIGAELGKAVGKTRIVISEIEHDSVYITAKSLENRGFEVITVNPRSDGIIHPEDVEGFIDENTAFVSVMAANNEIGTIQPIKEICEICKSKGAYFHTDAVQAAGHIKIDVKDLRVDMLSISAHKFGGVKGVGALYIKSSVDAKPFILGGGQEFGLRSGTEPLPLIVAMAAALEESVCGIEEKNIKTALLRDRLISKLLLIPDTVLNGSLENRLAGNVNLSFGGVNADAMLLMLDEAGISAAKGSACHSGSEIPSRVLTAIGRNEFFANGSIRFSLSNENTAEEINYIAETVENIIKKMQ